MELFYGEYDSTGAIVRDTAHCILSGKGILTGDIVANLPNSPYFVRVSARRAAEVTPDMLNAALAAIRKSTGAGKPRKGEVNAAAPETKEES